METSHPVLQILELCTQWNNYTFVNLNFQVRIRNVLPAQEELGAKGSFVAALSSLWKKCPRWYTDLNKVLFTRTQYTVAGGRPGYRIRAIQSTSEPFLIKNIKAYDWK